MRSMKRFVSYLYSIYNNQKIHNAGFARIELRTGRNRIEIHLKDIGYAGKTGTVYLFVRNEKNIQGVSIGNITFRGNQADFRYEQAEEIVGQTSWTIMQMNGIIITFDKKVAFLSQWDEIPVDTEKFEVWEQADKAQDNVYKSARGQSNIDITKGDLEKTNTDRNDQENGYLDGSNQKIGQIDNKIQEKKINRNNQKQINQKKMELDQDKSSQEGIDQSQDQTSQKRVNQDQVSQNEINSESQASQDNTNQSQGSQDRINQGQISQNVNSPGKGIYPANRNNSEQEIYQANRDEESQKFSSEQSSTIQTAEIQPQLQSGSQGWEQTWRYMLRAFPVIKQFDDKDDVLCVRIEIKDVRLLPDKYWSIVNNSFLLHGFFNYRYLAFGRIGQSWFIGVPGIYQNQEHAMASIFGFPDFLAQQRKNERGEQPGYWYRILELNLS